MYIGYDIICVFNYLISTHLHSIPKGGFLLSGSKLWNNKAKRKRPRIQYFYYEIKVLRGVRGPN